MPLGTAQIKQRLADGSKPTSPTDLVIRPLPDADDLQKSTASVNLHLGCWFATMRQSRVPLLHHDDDKERLVSKANLSPQQLDVIEDQLPITLSTREASIAKTYYVPFARPFVLHPQNFVLGVTLEWLRIPHDLAGYVIGRSRFGRRGLIIATAIGVHPNFVGCLTLELSNVGEVPIAVKPGTAICQLFLHNVQSGKPTLAQSQFASSRRPLVGQVRMDTLGAKLSEA
jgi:dCTP deaminase